MHSQRLREKNLSVWIVTKQTGEIETAHCDCVAGFSTVCSHVAATLFVIDKEIQGAEEVTRTGTKAYWMPPTNKPSEPKRVCQIDFTTPKKKFCDEDRGMVYKTANKENIPPPISTTEQIKFLEKLWDSEEPVTVVSHLVTNPFAEKLKDLSNSKKKLFIMSLFQEKYLQCTLEELQNIGKTFKRSEFV